MICLGTDNQRFLFWV